MEQSKKITYRDAINLALKDAMTADESVVVYGLDVTDHKRIFGSTEGLDLCGGGRFFSTPLSEEAMTGVGIGMAMNGQRPVHCHIRADFLLLCMNQLVNMAAQLPQMSDGQVKVPLTIRAVMGRGWGQGAQHSKSMHGILAHIPGIKCYLPVTPQDAYFMTRCAIAEDSLSVILEHRWLYDIEGEVDPETMQYTLSPEVVREGKDITVVAVSWMVVEALKMAEVMSRLHSVEIEVIDIRTTNPSFHPIFQSVNKTRNCMVADYDWEKCGFGEHIAYQTMKEVGHIMTHPVWVNGFADEHCPTARHLEDQFYTNAYDLIRVAEMTLGLDEADLSGEEFYSYENKFRGPF
jgi:pyruvate/2-oxoglutarate/acetoin dehydrogenase E1 component